MQVLVTVYPNLGFYTFLTATISSLCIGHITLYFHRKLVSSSRRYIDVDVKAGGGGGGSNDAADGHDGGGGPKHVPIYSDSDKNYRNEEIIPVSMMNHVFHLSPYLAYKVSSQRNKDVLFDIEDGNILHYIVMTLSGKVAFALFMIANITVLCFGVVAHSFQFEFKGLTGLLLKDKAIVPYSFYGISMAIPEASGDSSDPSPYYIQVALLIFGLYVPLVLYTSLLAIWMLPFTYRLQKKAYVLIEVLLAWSATDVFCLSIIASNLEIRQFAAFIVGDSCDNINNLLEKFLDKRLEGDDVCFDLISTLKEVIYVCMYVCI